MNNMVLDMVMVMVGNYRMFDNYCLLIVYLYICVKRYVRSAWQSGGSVGHVQLVLPALLLEHHHQVFNNYQLSYMENFHELSKVRVLFKEFIRNHRSIYAVGPPHHLPVGDHLKGGAGGDQDGVWTVRKLPYFLPSPE